MSGTSEQLQNRVRVSDKVVASARAYCVKIAEALAEHAIAVEGAATPATVETFKAVIFALANGLEHATQSMRNAEQAVTAEKSDDGPMRTKRDNAAAEVAALLIRLRSTIEDHLGVGGLTTYGLVGETPRVPRKILEQTKNVIQLLEKSPVALSSPFGGSFDSAAAVTTLRAKATILDGFIGDDDREARELDDAHALRDRAVGAWSDAYQGTATTLEGLYRCAGWNELAEKVRPTVRTLRGEDAGEDAGTEVEMPAPTNG